MVFELVKWFLVFVIYSVIGYFVEVSEVSMKGREVTNRGYLFGPVCPIYGFGGVIMVLCAEPFKNNAIVVFFIAMACCTILEYMTSFIMEKLFKARWWDYTYRPFNLNGRICLECSILFGLGGLAIIYVVHPFVWGILNSLQADVVWVAAVVAAILMGVDTVMSTIAATKVKYIIENTRKDVTAQAKKLAKGYYLHHKKVKKAIKDMKNTNNRYLKHRKVKKVAKAIKGKEKK